eukprot:2766111-Alexandrium_andersonii.AAC.1
MSVILTIFCHNHLDTGWASSYLGSLRPSSCMPKNHPGRGSAQLPSVRLPRKRPKPRARVLLSQDR